MKKEDLIFLLRTYKENKSKLKLKLMEKESILKEINFEDIHLSTTSYEQNSDIHSKNSISDKTGKMASCNVDEESELKEKLRLIEIEIEELIRKVDNIEIRLEALREKEKNILIAYYIEGNTYEEIGNVTYYKLYGQTRSDKAIQKIVERATEKMTRL